MTLHGKRVLITGATGGLGPSLVEAFLAMGADVIAVARRRTGLDDLRAGVQRHEHLDVAECDVADPGGVESLYGSVERKAPLDAVVHGVGAFGFGELEDVPDDEVARLVHGNLTATTLVVRGALRRMSSRGAGRIAVVAADRPPASGLALYGAAKAGVAHLVDAAALEAHPRGVRVNALLPGIMDTAANRAAMPKADHSTWVAPRTVAKAAVWLAGPDAEGVSGAHIRLPAG